MRIVDRAEKDLLGEGPVWVAERERLFWVDIKAPALRWMDLRDGTCGSHAFAERIGWIIPRAGKPDFVIGLKSGFYLFDLETSTITPIGNPEPDRPHNRLNDAKVDTLGRIWAGSKDDRDEDASGALYRLDPDLTWTRHDDGYQITNGPTFSLDGRTLYHTDSSKRTIYSFNLSKEGILSGKRAFIQFEDEWGYPDGMTTDAEGCLWVAHWGGARISRFSPEGEWMRSISIPATNVTSMAFAGTELDRLFVTTAGEGLTDEAGAGGLFEVDAGVHGMPVPPFSG